jgi:hypothetical protein
MACEDLYAALEDQQSEVAKLNYELVKLQRDIIAHLQVPEDPPQSLLDEVTAMHDDIDSVEYTISQIQDEIDAQGC